jgi:flagellar FliL protein
MAANADDKKDEGTEGAAAPAAAARKRSGPTVLLVLALVPLLLVAGGAGAYFAFFSSGSRATEKAAEPASPKPMVFYNLPELLVNLNGQGRRANFLKMSLSLELSDPADIPRIEAVLPRIVDAFQTYLREMRPEDLRGSAGLYRLREELLARVNSSAQPARVSDVLFKEMLIQ